MIVLTWEMINTATGNNTVIAPYKGKTDQKFDEPNGQHPCGVPTGKMSDNLQQVIKWMLNHVRWTVNHMKGQYRKRQIFLTYEGHTIPMEFNFTQDQNAWDQAYHLMVGQVFSELSKKDKVLWTKFQEDTAIDGTADEQFNSVEGQAAFAASYLEQLVKAQKTRKMAADLKLKNEKLEAAYKALQVQTKEKNGEIKALVEGLLAPKAIATK